MKKYICSTILLIVALVAIKMSVMAQSLHLDLLQSMYENRDAYSSMSYSVEYKSKTFSALDTTTLSADVILVRHKEDSFLGGYLLLRFDDSWIGYNGENILNAIFQDSSLVVVDVSMNPAALIKSTQNNNLIENGFLDGNRSLLEVLADSSYKTRFFDTIIQQITYPGLLVDIPDSYEFSNEQLILVIDTIANYFIKRIHRVEFQENIQYSEWSITNIIFSDIRSIQEIQAESLSAFNRVKYSSDKTDVTQSISNVSFENLSGNLLLKDQYFSQKIGENRIILLDFWYTACYPCIKSIPKINQLYHDFQNEGLVVIGVNVIDDEEKHYSRLEKFVRNNRMDYPTVMIEPQYKSYWQVPAYPYVVILDKQGNVLMQKEGYSDMLYEELKTFVSSYLSKD